MSREDIGRKDNGRDAKVIARGAVRGETLSGLVTLFSIDLGDETLRCPVTWSHGHVGFGGDSYAAIPIAAKGFAWSAEGPPAHPQIELSNPTRLFDGLARTGCAG